MDAERYGELLARTRNRTLPARTELVRRARGRPPVLTVLATREPASRRFVDIKRAVFEEAGAELRAVWVAPDASTADVARLIEAANGDADTDAIFLQFPLPAGIDAQACADRIHERRDVDVSGAAALGRLLTPGGRRWPATVGAVHELLLAGLGELRQRSVLLVSAGEPAERALLLRAGVEGAICTITSPLDAALPDQLAGVDAVVLLGELPAADTLRHVRQGAVLVDAAYDQPARPMGWLPERVRERLGAYYPQYGNVGPLTVTLLLEATVDAALNG